LKLYREQIENQAKKRNTDDPRKKVSPEIRAALDVYHAETEETTQRYIGAISDNFQHQVSAVAEQFLGLNEKVDGIKEDLNEVKRVQNIHTEMIGKLAEDVSVLHDEMKNVKNTLETKADKTDIKEIKDMLSAKAGKSDVARHERRVTELERA